MHDMLVTISIIACRQLFICFMYFSAYCLLQYFIDNDLSYDPEYVFYDVKVGSFI